MILKALALCANADAEGVITGLTEGSPSNPMHDMKMHSPDNGRTLGNTTGPGAMDRVTDVLRCSSEDASLLEISAPRRVVNALGLIIGGGLNKDRQADMLSDLVDATLRAQGLQLSMEMLEVRQSGDTAGVIGGLTAENNTQQGGEHLSISELGDWVEKNMSVNNVIYPPPPVGTRFSPSSANNIRSPASGFALFKSPDIVGMGLGSEASQPVTILNSEYVGLGLGKGHDSYAQVHTQGTETNGTELQASVFGGDQSRGKERANVEAIDTGRPSLEQPQLSADPTTVHIAGMCYICIYSMGREVHTNLVGWNCGVL